jgi:hypothetical protein
MANSVAKLVLCLQIKDRSGSQDEDRKRKSEYCLGVNTRYYASLNPIG